ncbi:hypothetical protein R3X25_02265 [Lutibacter sp. TH_r2]|uniref:hypothetical protein n=1 Tax=Lutibacter sp. TH_r2 TaxID=3082083 RepID=UPI002952E1F6|nr:hypothetical protein [Lutibacter sp. TH_r2]MDV7186093.1 hypothetical protein [Lutibacter sp. TH_r2]
MIKKEIIYFDKEIEILNYYKGKSDLLILAGHYILDYNEKTECLKPLIFNSKNSDFFNKKVEIEVGTFPENTFKLGVELINSTINSKITLLVNDHKFPSLKDKNVKAKIPVLRRNYFKELNDIPTEFKNILGNNPYDNFILDNNDLREDNQILASETFLFSEYVFRKRFDRSLKNKMLELDAFYTTKTKSRKRNVFFKNLFNESFCIIEDGNCGCSGEIMQVIYDLVLKRQQFNFVLFIPIECGGAVVNGCEAIQYYLDVKKDIKINIDIISGFPYEKYSDFLYEKITLTKITND